MLSAGVAGVGTVDEIAPSAETALHRELLLRHTLTQLLESVECPLIVRLSDDVDEPLDLRRRHVVEHAMPHGVEFAVPLDDVVTVLVVSVEDA